MSLRKPDFKKILEDEKKRSDLRDVSSIRTDSRGSFRLIDISLDKIKTREQVRKHIDPDSILELMGSIRSQGLTNPVEVVDSGDHYTLILGHRRLAAFLKLNYATIPAIVRTGLSEEDIVERQMIENLQREDLDPIDEAQAYAQLMDVKKINQNEVADRIGKSKQYISGMMGIFTLVKKVQSTGLLNKLSKTLLFEFVPYSDDVFLEIAIKKAIDENLGQKEIRELLKNLKSGKSFDRDSARQKRDYEEAKKDFLNIIESAQGGLLKFQLKYGKGLTPDKREEMIKDLSPIVKQFLDVLNIYFPGSGNYNVTTDIGKPAIKFPGLDESLSIDTSLLDINYSFLDWTSSIDDIKNFIKERLPDLQDSIFKDFEPESIADYWNALAFSKNGIPKPAGYFFKAITGKYPLPPKYKILKNKAKAKSSSNTPGKFDKYKITGK